MLEWRPHPGKQEEALRRNEFEVLYGGQRGGGKTDAGLVWLTEYIQHPRYRALVIRKNSEDLSDWIDRAAYLYQRYGARPTGKPATITFPSGAKIRTGHLKDDLAYTKYQGHEYQRILIEELTQIPDETRYLQLISSCRTSIPELIPQIFCTTNPGGLGHAWVKARFIDVAPPVTRYIDPETGLTRIFIPAGLDDNPTLLTANPQYVQQLEALKATNYELYMAWRHGSWDVFVGQFFPEFRRQVHVIPFVRVASTLPKVGSLDWGYAAPHCFLGSAIMEQSSGGIKFNRLITYKEIYGTEQTPEELAKHIVDDVPLKEYTEVRCDPAMFHKQPDGSLAIIDQMRPVLGDHFYKFKPANNDRIGGWAMVHKWLSMAADNLPYWLIMENCLNLIRTLPLQVHDEHNVEDIDTEGEDHASDTARYQQVHVRWTDTRYGEIKRPRPAGIRRGIKSPVLINPDKFGTVKAVPLKTL